MGNCFCIEKKENKPEIIKCFCIEIIDKPEIDIVKPENDIVKPEIDIVKPENDIVKPENNIVKPENNIVKPEIDIVIENKPKIKVALKFPHGLSGITIDKEIKECQNINEWISSLYYLKEWKGWLVYNDEIDTVHKKGHCKGILAWNDTHLSWLVHSVPHFPKEFSGNIISEIEKSEHMYGQSFFYIERECDSSFLEKVIHQVYNMEAHIYLKKCELSHYKKEDLLELSFSDDIIHVSKSPRYEIDIYSEYLAKKEVSLWYVETWKRGLHIKTECSNVVEIKKICWKNISYKQSQDHSKWAACKSHYYIGDLNRMTSQFHRGGGGFLVKDSIISNLLINLISL
jgi:hypothetical protein